jgi:hypothetical protein
MEIADPRPGANESAAWVSTYKNCTTPSAMSSIGARSFSQSNPTTEMTK